MYYIIRVRVFNYKISLSNVGTAGKVTCWPHGQFGSHALWFLGGQERASQAGVLLCGSSAMYVPRCPLWFSLPPICCLGCLSFCIRREAEDPPLSGYYCPWNLISTVGWRGRWHWQHPRELGAAVGDGDHLLRFPCSRHVPWGAAWSRRIMGSGPRCPPFSV